MVHPAPIDQLTDEHALVDQGDVEVARDQAPVTVFHLTRISRDALQALHAEVVLEEQMLAVRRHLTPVEDRNGRRFVRPPRPLVETIQQRVYHPMAREQGTHLVAAQKGAHGGQCGEYVREHIAVALCGWRLSVVLGDGESVAVGEQKRVQSRGGAGGAESVLVLDERLLPIGEAELSAECGIGHGAEVGFSKCAQQGRDMPLEVPILLGGHEARAQHSAQRPLAKDESPPALLLVELRLRLGGDLVAEQRVIGFDGFPQATHGVPPACISPGLRPGQGAVLASAGLATCGGSCRPALRKVAQCSSRRCERGFFASWIAMSAMCLTAQSK